MAMAATKTARPLAGCAGGLAIGTAGLGGEVGSVTGSRSTSTTDSLDCICVAMAPPALSVPAAVPPEPHEVAIQET